MKRSLIFIVLMQVLLVPIPVFSATLQNTDSQPYELQIQESGQSYASHYRIIENANIEICFYGCQIVLLNTGQTVAVNPKDSVVIDNGVMSVTSGD